MTDNVSCIEVPTHESGMWKWKLAFRSCIYFYFIIHFADIENFIILHYFCYDFEISTPGIWKAEKSENILENLDIV